MGRILRQRPSPAMIVACIALAVALSGSSYAALRLPANSIGTKQLRKNAVTSPKVKNGAITGADVNEASLGQVPTAANATSATSANHATSADRASAADSAERATTAVTANAAFSTKHDAAIPLPNTLDAIATLTIPAAGYYVVHAKFGAFNASTTTASPSDDCRLVAAGVTGDRLFFDVDASTADNHEAVALQLVQQFTAPGQVVLRCTDAGGGDVNAFDTKITAIQVAQLTDSPF
jgi:hypothetical protein